jgi:membrane fusion protein (multidrug efflux system)
MSTTIDEEEVGVQDEPKEPPVLIDEHGEPLQPAHVEPETRKRPLYRRPAFLIAAVIVLLVGGAVGIRYWLYARSHETTDDAFIDAHVTPVSPKVSGYVAKIHVQANQQVKKGDLLLEIDPRDYESRLDQAKAALAAGEARLKEAQTGVELTRASSRASVQQASGTVQQAQAGVEAQRVQAATERTRVTQANAAIEAAQANLQQAQAQVQAAQAELVRAQADVARYQELYSKDEVSRQRLDQAIATARTAEAQTEAARQRAAAAASQVSVSQAAQRTAAETARHAEVQIGAAQGQVREAQGRLAAANTAPQQIASSEAQAQTASASLEQLRAAVAQAEIELSYTRLYAPDDGRVTNKSVEEGALVQAGQPLMAIVPGDVWVTANFKENQIGNLQPGQPVNIRVDAFPGKTFRGHVDSIQAGTGARFSLLPPENATGNYVKVVQRVPVKIVFDETLDPQHMLAPGMSVEPEVRVR